VDTLLRPRLLAGVAILLAGPSQGQSGGLADPLRALGADVTGLELPGPDEEDLGLEGINRIDTLVLDARALRAVPDALDATWSVVVAAAKSAMIPDGRGGKVVLLAPPPPAEAARAGLENMARTLSVEWARFQIRPTTIAPGERSTDEELATLTAYLASPAGDYFSGTRLSLGGVTPG